MLEGLGISGVVHDDDAVRAAVVAAGDGAEALLPCRVPDLQLDGLALELDRADFLRAPGSECVVRRVRGGWTGPRPGQSRKAARQRAPPPAPLSAEATPQRGGPLLAACGSRRPPSRHGRTATTYTVGARQCGRQLTKSTPIVEMWLSV